MPLQNKEGQEVPSATFMIIEKGEWKKRTTDDIFKGKKVVVFSLPGAFTPTCSSQHLPRYNELAPLLKKHGGVDTVACISVNDTFVMNEWAQNQEAQNIMMLPDGNGEFSKGMGMLVDKTAIGFGMRSWRYSMLVDDKKIVKMFIEPEKEGDPFETSDADTMLKFIAPSAVLPQRIAIFTRSGCPHCAKAKQLLADKNLKFEEVELPHKNRGVILGAMTGKMTVPQIFIDGKLIGGNEELEAYLKSKGL